MLSVADALDRLCEELAPAAESSPVVPWIAFSGGLDSSVLLDAVAHRGRCRAVHVNHGLSPLADRWQAHCETVCRELDVPLEVRRISVPPGNVEAEARRLRYKAFEALLAQDDVIFTAHHANDQAETRLWQLVTGRPTVGMPVTRPLGGGRLFRPFLGVLAHEVRRYAKDRGLAWVEDPMNRDQSFDRVFIRRDLLPRIEAKDPAAVAKMARGAEGRDRRGDVVDWLEALVRKRLSRATLDHLAQVRAAGSGVLSIDASLELVLFGQTWRLRRRLAPAEFGGEYAVGEDIEYPGYGQLVWRRSSPGFRRGESVEVQPRHGVIRQSGRHRSVKDLLREAGIAPFDRRDRPVLVRAGRVVSVVGIATDDSALVTNGYLPHWIPQSREIDRFFDARVEP